MSLWVTRGPREREGKRAWDEETGRGAGVPAGKLGDATQCIWKMRSERLRSLVTTVSTGAVTETRGLGEGGVPHPPGRAEPECAQEHHGDARSAPKPQAPWQSSLWADARRSDSEASQKAKRVLRRRRGRDQEPRSKCPGERGACAGVSPASRPVSAASAC